MGAIYLSISFLAAYLLFVIQPLMGKLVLPLFGGGPLVWNGCLLFFQTLLLLGYLYTYWICRGLGLKKQIFLHLFVFSSVWISYPFNFELFQQNLDVSSWPLTKLWWVLGMSLGPIFFVLSTTGPLIQKWWSWNFGVSQKTYKLYAYSNAGSLLALVLFPIVLEPLLSATIQIKVWFVLLACVHLGLVLCGLGLLKKSPLTLSHQKKSNTTTKQSLNWLILSLLPSALLYAVTTHILTNIAAIPLLWIIPLLLYLVTFILAFAGKLENLSIKIGRVFCLIASMLVIISLVEANHPTWLILPLHLLGLVLAALTCHARLYQLRPSEDQLTGYYLWLAFGGVLGGVLTTLVAPLLFNRILEYPLVLIMVIGIRELAKQQRLEARDWLQPLYMGMMTLVCILVVQWQHIEMDRVNNLLMFGIPLLLTYRWVERPKKHALGLLAILIASTAYTSRFGDYLYFKRNFFGTTRVSVDKQKRFMALIHGDTIHGMQSLDPAQSRLPLTYFGPAGPAGDVFEWFNKQSGHKNVAVMGLGAGTMASYARDNHAWFYYEINPSIVEVARQRQYFSYLSDAVTQHLSIITGDARLKLKQEPEHFFDLIFMDTFSSDSIPVHLVTQEAIDIYQKRLRNDGILLFNISNRYLNMQNILCRLAIHNKYRCLSKRHRIREREEMTKGFFSSHYVSFLKPGQPLIETLLERGWEEPQVLLKGRIWTDQFSNIFETFSWWK